MKNGTDDKTQAYAFLLFLVWPFLAVISALNNHQQQWGKNILWAFSAFYGFTFAVDLGSDTGDIVRYIASYQSLHGTRMGFFDSINYFLASGQIDILKTFLEILLSRFSDSHVLLTLVYGTIFGFFLSRNIWYLFGKLKGRLYPITVVLVLCFFLANPIWFLNGFRMWTAAHIFIYGLLPFLLDGNRKRLIFCFLSILVHFSFILPFGLLLIYLAAGNRLSLYFSIFLFSFFVSEINIEAFNNIIESYAPEIFQERTAGYRNVDYVEDVREGPSESLRWYAVWYGRALSWSIAGFLTLLYFIGKEFFRDNRSWLSLFSFSLIIAATANILSSIPSMGRFTTLANMSSLFLIAMYVQNIQQERALKWYFWVAVPALLLYIVVAIRIGLYSMSATSILGNPVLAFFIMGEHISLNDFIKSIL